METDAFVDHIFGSGGDNVNQRVSERTGVPRSTLSQWRIRYQTDEAFAQRIDLFLAEGQGLPSSFVHCGPIEAVQSDVVASYRSASEYRADCVTVPG